MAVVSEHAVPGQATYLPQLDGLRAVLASYVVIHHAFYQAWPPELYVDPPRMVRVWLPWLHFGHYAVNVFIVLSGFVLALPVIRHGELRGGWRRFLVGRFWRIIPAYYAAIALSVLLLTTGIGAPTGTHWDVATRWTSGSVLAALGLVHDWFGHGAVSYVFWSVAVEFKIYLLFPAIVAAWHRFGLPVTATVLAAVAVGLPRLIRAWFGVDLAFWDDILPWYLALFLMGVLAAVVATATDPRWARWRGLPWGWFCLLGSAAVVGLGYREGTTWIYDHLSVVDLLVGVVASCGLTAIVSRPGRASRLLTTRPLVGVGTFAYSLYLIHAPLLQVVHQTLIFPLHLTRGGQFVALVGFGYPLIVLASYGFFRLFERPFLPRRRLAAEAIAVGAGQATAAMR